MHNSLAVHMLQSTRDLVNVSPDLLFLEGYFILLRSLHNKLEVALLGPLDGNEELIQLVVNEPVQIFHYIRVV